MIKDVFPCCNYQVGSLYVLTQVLSFEVFLIILFCLISIECCFTLLKFSKEYLFCKIYFTNFRNSFVADLDIHFLPDFIICSICYSIGSSSECFVFSDIPTISDLVFLQFTIFLCKLNTPQVKQNFSLFLFTLEQKMALDFSINSQIDFPALIFCRASDALASKFYSIFPYV